MGLADYATPAVIAAGIPIVGGAGRWALRLWATVRREAVEAAIRAADKRAGFEAAAATRRENFEEAMADLQRTDNARMIDALINNASSNAALAGKIDTLSSQLANLARDVRDVTPPLGFERPVVGSEDSERRRAARTPATGVRMPRPGTHHDKDR